MVKSVKTKQFSILMAIVFLHLFIFNSISAQQYFEGYIKLNDGLYINGQVKNFTSNQNKIHINLSNQKKEKIASKEIDEIALFLKEDTIYFHKHKLVKYAAGYRRVRPFDGICWASLYYYSDNIQVYQYNWKESHALWVPSVPFFAPFSSKHITYGLKFPEDDYIIDVSGHGGFSKKKMIGKKLYKIFSRKCQNFKEADKEEKNALKTLEQFLEFYEKICGNS